MGILLDSTGLIVAERAGHTPRQVIASLIASQGDVVAAVSVITVIELAHGMERADTAQRRRQRERFLDELLAEIAVEAVSIAIAFRAGRIDGSCRRRGYGWHSAIC